MKLFRYECRTCKARGRWVRNGNAAIAAAERHRDRFEHGHDSDIVDNAGHSYGTA